MAEYKRLEMIECKTISTDGDVNVRVAWILETPEELSSDEVLDLIVNRRPKGKWINEIGGIYICSNCDKQVITDNIKRFKYCYECGAEMDSK